MIAAFAIAFGHKIINIDMNKISKIMIFETPAFLLYLRCSEEGEVKITYIYIYLKYLKILLLSNNKFYGIFLIGLYIKQYIYIFIIKILE